MKANDHTPTPTVMAMSRIAFHGNIIPHEWYHRLKDGRGNAHLAAINILADIVYWYRPRIVRHEPTGAILRYERRFEADKLQRSYAQIAEQFGLSKGQAKSAVDYLCERGIITREFRNIPWRGQVLANVMFLEPVIAEIDRLSAPLQDIPDLEADDALAEDEQEEGHPLGDIPQVGRLSGGTYTEISTEISQREESDGVPSGHSPASEPETPIPETPNTFEGWNKLLQESGNRQAILVRMYKTLFPEHDPPSYSYMGKMARRLGAGRLAAELWQCAVRPPLDDVLAYIQKKVSHGGDAASPRAEYKPPTSYTNPLTGEVVHVGTQQHHGGKGGARIAANRPGRDVPGTRDGTDG